MEAVVSDILQSRKHEPGGLKKTAVVSFAAHAAALAVLAFLPGVLPQAAEKPRVVMSISLGGAPGPNTGGMQMIGGRNIEAAKPAETPSVAPRIIPPSVTPPKMALPDPRQKPRTPPKSSVTSNDPRGTERGRGFETQLGTARVETGAKGQGFGLSSGGGGGTGGYLDVQNFCCPEYIADMINRVRRNWNQNQQATGVVLMKFTILRNGQITGIEVEKPSGYAPLDIESQRALVNTSMLAPLPAAFPESQLPVHLSFEYERRR
ncbi:MAG: TonB family protein [Acidobacteria bacterium]|nr:MAG: TonB family protein [Acidobacteriota bacterium]